MSTSDGDADAVQQRVAELQKENAELKHKIEHLQSASRHATSLVEAFRRAKLRREALRLVHEILYIIITVEKKSKLALGFKQLDKGAFADRFPVDAEMSAKDAASIRCLHGMILERGGSGHRGLFTVEDAENLYIRAMETFPEIFSASEMEAATYALEQFARHLAQKRKQRLRAQPAAEKTVERS